MKPMLGVPITRGRSKNTWSTACNTGNGTRRSPPASPSPCAAALKSAPRSCACRRKTAASSADRGEEWCRAAGCTSPSKRGSQPSPSTSSRSPKKISYPRCPQPVPGINDMLTPSRRCPLPPRERQVPSASASAQVGRGAGLAFFTVLRAVCACSLACACLAVLDSGLLDCCPERRPAVSEGAPPKGSKAAQTSSSLHASQSWETTHACVKGRVKMAMDGSRSLGGGELAGAPYRAGVRLQKRL
jgi:hypothetical protein